MSRERRDISKRKIRRIKRTSEEPSFRLDSETKDLSPEKIKPNTMLYYTKVVFGIGSGAFAGIFFTILQIAPPIDIWLIFLVVGFLSCVAFVRYVLRLSSDVLDQKRLWLSGTFTFVLLFIVVTTLIWMLPGPRLPI